MKKRISVYLLLLVALLVFIPSSKYLWNSKNVIQTNNVAQYRIGLAEINRNYFDQYENRIIVKSKYKIDDRKCLIKASGLNGLNIIQYKNSNDAIEALNHYSELDYVEYAYVDQQITLDTLETTTTSIPLDNSHLSWGGELLGVDDYQNFLLTKYGALKNLPEIYIAVLDTGIDTDNEFLRGRIAFEHGISYYDSVEPSNYAFEDDNSHGTHVSGTIVDLTLGNVKIIPIKILSNEGKGSISNVVSGLEYVINLKNNGLNVVASNMSLGGIKGFTNKEELAIESMYDNNIMPVVAAGNENYYVEEFEPACVEKALTISALTQNDYYSKFLHISNFSNYGKGVDLCLPGSKILSCVINNAKYENITTSKTGGKYAELNGTSMATPHATALVALYATYYGKDYDVKVVESDLKKYTYDFGELGKDDLYGYGVPCMSLAINEDELTVEPSLSHGNVGGEYHFDDRIEVELADNNKSSLTHKIYYTLDGSYPTLTSHLEYDGAIEITNSTMLRFAIYSFDNNGNIKGNSKLFEVTYFKGEKNVNDDGYGFEIDKYGNVKSYNCSIKDIVLPEYINGIKVKKLDSNLFYGLNINSFVCNFDCKLGYYPFVSCGELKYVKLESKEAKYICNACFALEELVVPNVTEIQEGLIFSPALGFVGGSSTFKKCFNLRKIVAPKVNEIKNSTYAGQKHLEVLDIDWENISQLEGYAFEACAMLEYDIVLPDTITTIPKYAFSESGIKSIVGKNVTSVDINAFYMCNNLTTVSFGKIQELKNYAFGNCPLLINNFEFDVGAVLEDRAFYNCDSFDNIDLTNIVSVGKYAFSSCEAITEVELPNCQYDAAVFELCRNLVRVTLSPEIKTIPEKMFCMCWDLASVNLENVEHIGASAFESCDKLTNLNLSSLQELQVDETGIGANFKFCHNLTSVTLSESLTSIPDSAFMSCYNLENINLENVELIENNAFTHCTKLKTLNLSSISKIAKNSFDKATAISVIVLDKNSVISNLENIELPDVSQIHISKSYSGQIAKHISDLYKYVYNDINENYVIYGKFQRYNVAFKLKDGTNIATQSLFANENIVFPGSFETEDKIIRLVGWKENGTGTTIYSSTKINPTADTTYIAYYTIEEYKKLKITFYYNYDYDKSKVVNDDGDKFTTLDVEKNGIILLGETPYKEPSNEYTYKFIGWEYNGVLYSANNLPKATENMSFYARYEQKTRYYKVTWYSADKQLLYFEYLPFGALPEFKFIKAVFNTGLFQLLTATNIESVLTFWKWSWLPQVSVVKKDCEFYYVKISLD